MIKAYFNYLDPAVTVHQNPNCAHAKVGPDQRIRHVLINADSLSKELARFRNNKYRFAEEPGLNDVWLILDFQDPEFETALVRHLKRIVGLLYSPIKSCEVRVHC
jgi:hypothetical protein